MLIGGFTPFTLTDYPGEIAAICFAQGCNFSCPFCHNRLLIPRRPMGSSQDSHDCLGSIFSFLEERKGRLSALVVSGGEPTLQDDLSWFMDRVRSLGLRIKLDTNGSRPGVLKKLLEKKLVDLVAMDIKAPWPRYHVLAGGKADTGAVKESLQLILDSGIDHIFRTTLVPDLLDQSDIRQIRDMLPSDARYVVQPYVEPGLAA